MVLVFYKPLSIDTILIFFSDKVVALGIISERFLSSGVSFVVAAADFVSVGLL